MSDYRSTSDLRVGDHFLWCDREVVVLARRTTKHNQRYRRYEFDVDSDGKQLTLHYDSRESVKVIGP